MIQANELRIGNWVKKEDEHFKVTSYTFCIVERDPDQFAPIPLTEEILLKCPAAVFNPISKILRNYNIDLGRDRVLSISDIDTPNAMIWLSSIDPKNRMEATDIINLYNFDYNGKMYLHQLQNLYFALTQKELDINLNSWQQ